jgi:hypothetical protein
LNAYSAQSNRNLWSLGTERFTSRGLARSVRLMLRSKRSDGTTIHVECRMRSGRQDVQWIEELAGRRLSLGIDGIMAVSANGFSENAHKTGRLLRVQTWDLADLGSEGVASLFEAPEIWLPVFRNISVNVVYTTPSSSKSTVKILPEPLVVKHWRLVHKRILGILIESFDYGDVSASTKHHRIDEKDEVSVDGVIYLRTTIATFDFSWECGRTEIYKGFRKWHTEEPTVSADLYLSEFSGGKVESILSREKWRISIDLSDLLFPKGAVVGSAFEISNDRIQRSNVEVRLRKPKCYDVTFDFSYSVSSDP